MANVFQRVIQHLANEVITKSLANARWFQRFAAKTHHHVTYVSKEGTKKIEEVTEKIAKDENVKEAAGTFGYRLGVFAGRVAQFPARFVANVRREMDKIASQQQPPK